MLIHCCFTLFFSYFLTLFFMGDGHLQELSLEGEIFTPSDVERALWSRAIGEKLKGSKSQLDPNNGGKTGTKRKRKTSK